MLSFKSIDNNEQLSAFLNSYNELSEEEISTFKEIVESLVQEDEDVEYTFAISDGCVLVRIFDTGRYLFLFPIPLTEIFDLKAALFAAAEYSKVQEIPLTFSDVPISDFFVFSGFSHFDCDMEDEQEQTYRVKVKNECELIDEVPDIVHPRVTLNALTEEDISLYARLNKDESVSNFWGYDYKEDNPNATDEYFFLEALREFSVGSAISFAVRAEGGFIGEAVIFAFDRRGSAEFAVRLLPEWQGQGLGKCAMLALFDAARKMGLRRLFAIIKKDNLPSCNMASSCMTEFSADDAHRHFVFEL